MPISSPSSGLRWVPTFNSCCCNPRSGCCPVARFLTHLCDLHVEVLFCLAEINSPLVKYLEDMNWVAKLAYLSDIFGWINTFNTSLQGKECQVFSAHHQLAVFRKKAGFVVCSCQMGISGNVLNFGRCCGESRSAAGLQTANHQCALAGVQWAGEWFQEETLANQWVRNPFSFLVTTVNGLTPPEEEALINLISNMDLEKRMNEMLLGWFWLFVETKFPTLFRKAVKVLIPSAPPTSVSVDFLHGPWLKASPAQGYG